MVTVVCVGLLAVVLVVQRPRRPMDWVIFGLVAAVLVSPHVRLWGRHAQMWRWRAEIDMVDGERRLRAMSEAAAVRRPDQLLVEDVAAEVGVPVDVFVRKVWGRGFPAPDGHPVEGVPWWSAETVWGWRQREVS